ncbi:glutamate--tRNA ligase, partial [Patescibacteria group bacterium]|nr:glutamate--tRNA ligase [Patescibacteria group bacterium]
MSNVRVRIPPSPTGLLHIGTVRTALYNYLFAKHESGKMIFRIEDTDKERSKKEYEEDIINGLVKLGIAGDEGVHIPGDKGYRQSERTDVYTADLKKLLDENKAYYCFCSKERLEEMREKQRENKLPPRYDGCCKNLDPAEAKKRVEAGEQAVIRLRVPENEDLSFHDLVRGETCIECKELDDFVIARAIDDPLYHLTVVVDDHDMGITHVIRGEDHISNTPKQILIFKALDYDIPQFAHLPLILNEDKSKLSKRKNKVSVDDYLNDGYLPEALLNFLALLGWNPGTEQEILSMDELIEKFTLDRVHKGGAVFDLKKLDWINGEYIKREIAENIDEFYE